METKVFDTDHLLRTYFQAATPAALGLVVTLIYNLADTYFIAQTGDTALVAGVSVCAPVFTTLMAFGNIFGQGGSSLISRLLGRQDRTGAAQVSAFCFYAALAVGAVLGAGMLLFCDPLLGVLGASAETLPHARRYYTVLAAGAPVVVLSFIHSNLLRCEGMAAQSMVGNITGTLVNLVLDPLLISGLGLGSFGAAAATVAGYTCADLYYLRLVLRKSQWLSVAPRHCRIGAAPLRQVLGVGGAAALTNLMQSLTVTVLNQFLLPYGSTSLAAMGIVLKINMIAQLAVTGFAFGGVPVFGYLYGAGLQRHLARLTRFCLGFLCTLSAVLTAVLWLGAPQLVRIFMQDEAIVAAGTQMLRWQAAGGVFAAVVLLLTVLFQATGQIGPAFALSLSRQGVVFLLALAVGTRWFGYTGILVAQPAADFLSALLALGLYVWQGRKSKRKESRAESKE